MNTKLDYKQGYKAFTGLFTREMLEAVLPSLLLVLLALVAHTGQIDRITLHGHV